MQCYTWEEITKVEMNLRGTLEVKKIKITSPNKEHKEIDN